MLWIIAPLVISLFLIQLYFGRNKDEELGWNTAYANAIALIFVSVHLARYLYESYGHTILFSVGTDPFYKSLFVFGLFVDAFFLMLIDFFHALPKRITFFICSSVTVDVLAFFAIIVVHSTVPLDFITLYASLLFFAIASLLFALLRWMVPPSPQAKIYLKKRHDALEKERAERRRLMQEKFEYYREKVRRFFP